MMPELTHLMIHVNPALESLPDTYSLLLSMSSLRCDSRVIVPPPYARLLESIPRRANAPQPIPLHEHLKECTDEETIVAVTRALGAVKDVIWDVDPSELYLRDVDITTWGDDLRCARAVILYNCRSPPRLPMTKEEIAAAARYLTDVGILRAMHQSDAYDIAFVLSKWFPPFLINEQLDRIVQVFPVDRHLFVKLAMDILPFVTDQHLTGHAFGQLWRDVWRDMETDDWTQASWIAWSSHMSKRSLHDLVVMINMATHLLSFRTETFIAALVPLCVCAVEKDPSLLHRHQNVAACFSRESVELLLSPSDSRETATFLMRVIINPTLDMDRDLILRVCKRHPGLVAIPSLAQQLFAGVELVTDELFPRHLRVRNAEECIRLYLQNQSIDTLGEEDYVVEGEGFVSTPSPIECIVVSLFGYSRRQFFVQKLNDACRQGSEEGVESVLRKMADFRAPAITGAEFHQFEFPELVVDTWLRLFRRERWMQDYMTEVQNPIMETLIGMNRPCTVGTQAMTSWVLTCLRRGTLEGVETHVGLMGSPGCMSAMMILNQILANGMARERVQWAEMVARCGEARFTHLAIPVWDDYLWWLGVRDGVAESKEEEQPARPIIQTTTDLDHLSWLDIYVAAYCANAPFSIPPSLLPRYYDDPSRQFRMIDPPASVHDLVNHLDDTTLQRIFVESSQTQCRHYLPHPTGQFSFMHQFWLFLPVTSNPSLCKACPEECPVCCEPVTPDRWLACRDHGCCFSCAAKNASKHNDIHKLCVHPTCSGFLGSNVPAGLVRMVLPLLRRIVGRPVGEPSIASLRYLKDMGGSYPWLNVEALSSDERGYKHCPQCNVAIDRQDGCIHMTCPCGHEFCWSCMGPFHASYDCEGHARGELTRTIYMSQACRAAAIHPDSPGDWRFIKRREERFWVLFLFLMGLTKNGVQPGCDDRTPTNVSRRMLYALAYMAPTVTESMLATIVPTITDSRTELSSGFVGMCLNGVR
jgi:hypothetical protein